MVAGAEFVQVERKVFNDLKQKLELMKKVVK